MAVRIADLHLAAGEGFANRAAMGEPLGPRDPRVALAFCAPVQFVDALGTQPGDPRLFEPCGAGRGHVHHQAER